MLTVTGISADVLAEVSFVRITTKPNASFVDDQHDRRYYPWEYGESTFLRLSNELRWRQPTVRAKSLRRPVEDHLHFRSVLFSLLYTMVAGEKQSFSLRIAILYCVQCYLYKNDYGRSAIVQTLLPQQENGLP